MDVKTVPTAMLPIRDLNMTNPLKVSRGSADKNSSAAGKVAQEFEAMFVGMMLKSMRDTVGKDKLTGGGHGEETFRSLLDQEYAATAARNGGIGLAQMIEKELARTGAAPTPLKGAPDAD